MNTQKGAFVNFTKLENGTLKIEVTPTGKDELVDMMKQGNKSDEAQFLELIEDFLGSGWDTIAPEDICALTSGLIISDEARYNDEGELVEIGRVYHYGNYQIKSYLEELNENGFVIWEGYSE